jgi:CheY-like chemotaxis protein
VGARDGAEALDRIAQQRPDLVLTDLRMPLMDGLALARRLKADPTNRAIPVVLMTAHGGRGTPPRPAATVSSPSPSSWTSSPLSCGTTSAEAHGRVRARGHRRSAPN